MKYCRSAFLFDNVVTVGEDSAISIWNINTGKLGNFTFIFDSFHNRKKMYKNVFRYKSDNIV